MTLADWARRIAAIDAKIRPIATRPMGATDPPPVPLEEAGARNETESLLAEIAQGYRDADADERAAIRGVWAAHRSFAWAASLPFSPMTAALLRDHLTLFSVADQGPDTRDAILLLEGLCEAAARESIDAQPALREAEALSSDVDKYGMGSTRSLFLRHIR